MRVEFRKEKGNKGLWNIIFICFVIWSLSSSIGRIFYIELMGKSNIGEIVSIDQKTARSKSGRYEVFTPVVRVNDDGELFDVVAVFNSTSGDLLDPIGTKVKVKYLEDDKAMFIINEAEYLIKEILPVLNFISFASFACMLNLLSFDSTWKKSLNFNISKKSKIKFILLGIPVLLEIVLGIYYQFVVKNFSIINFNIVSFILNIIFLVFYLFAIFRFIRSNK
ncbi:hypothetical protein GNF80_10220 [Clostridium perfringens]|nr:hypothetical protein [Clostridium perfringens]